MRFDDYQEKAKKYDFFDERENITSPGFLEKTLGLVGEAGEVADKIKKLIRDKEGQLSEEDKQGVLKELGDTLWYIASLSRYLETPLSEVAQINLDKLESRWQRGTMHGEGDDR